MSMLPNVMILTGSIEVNKPDVVLVKAVYFILGKNQPMKKVLFLHYHRFYSFDEIRRKFLFFFFSKWGGKKNSVKSSKLSLSF